MIPFPQVRHIAFDLDSLVVDGDLSCDSIDALIAQFAIPDAADIGHLHTYMGAGMPVALLTCCVDDAAKTMRQNFKTTPDFILKSWYARMSRDMEIRVSLSVWCVQHLGFLLPLSDHARETTQSIFPLNPFKRRRVS